MKNVTISAIGQADDTLLLSNDIHALAFLLQLTLNFCKKHNVELSVEKLKLQAYEVSSKSPARVFFNPMQINGKTIPFSNEAEHVGILRSIFGNSPSILSRLSAHRAALASVLHTGMAKGHRAGPASSIRINQMYGIPVLLSGISSLVLSNKDIDIIERHHSETLRKLQRLLKNTPRCVTYFLSGNLPGAALVHLRQLCLFGMICRLQTSILHDCAMNFFTEVYHNRTSWFQQIRRWCLQYGLPHPLQLLYNPLSKAAMKTLAKKKVIDYWETKLRTEAESLKSLTYFNPNFMSLQTAHPIWLTASNSPRQVSMATIQAVMLSGRYRCGSLMQHWSPNNDGVCQLSATCKDRSVIEDLDHILRICPALHQLRLNLSDFTHNYSGKLHVDISSILLRKCNPQNPNFVHFLLDCSSDNDVIKLSQKLSPDILRHLYLVTRTWIFNLHRQRLRMLGRWRS